MGIYVGQLVKPLESEWFHIPYDTPSWELGTVVALKPKTYNGQRRMECTILLPSGFVFCIWEDMVEPA